MVEPCEVGQLSQPAVTAAHMGYRCVSALSMLYRKMFLEDPTQLHKSISSALPIFAVNISTNRPELLKVLTSRAEEVW